MCGIVGFTNLRREFKNEEGIKILNAMNKNG